MDIEIRINDHKNPRKFAQKGARPSPENRATVTAELLSWGDRSITVRLAGGKIIKRRIERDYDPAELGRLIVDLDDKVRRGGIREVLHGC